MYLSLYFQFTYMCMYLYFYVFILIFTYYIYIYIIVKCFMLNTCCSCPTDSGSRRMEFKPWSLQQIWNFTTCYRKWVSGCKKKPGDSFRDLDLGWWGVKPWPFKGLIKWPQGLKWSQIESPGKRHFTGVCFTGLLLTWAKDGHFLLQMRNKVGVEHRPVDVTEKRKKSLVKVRGLTNHSVNVYIAEKTFCFFCRIPCGKLP